MKRGGQGHPIYLSLLDDQIKLHRAKSSGYGTEADPFANFTAVARAKNQPRFVYPIDRIQEKVTRLYSLIEQGRFDELTEDLGDISSLSTCAHAMLLEDREDTDGPQPGPERAEA